MNDDDLEFISALVARRNPSLLDAVGCINAGTITSNQQTELVDALGEEIWENGMDAEGLTPMGDRLRGLIEAVWTVPHFAQQGAVTSVAAHATDD